MRILFLTDNFPPEYNAPATRTYEHCREWVKQGVEVTVITGFPNFPKGKVFEGYKNSWKKIEYLDGIKVIRVWTFISANEGAIKRSLDFLSFAFTSFVCGLGLKFDLIVATSPQFFTAVSGYGLSIFKRKPWVMEVRDLWPESIKAVNAVKSTWIIQWLEKLELFLYRHAQQVVVVTDSFKNDLKKRGIDPSKISVIKNGVDLSQFQVRPKNHALLKQLGLENKFVIGYVGTHGLAHGLDFILRSISKIQNPIIHFIFIGDGAEKENLQKLAIDLQLSNVTFLKPVKKSEIINYLAMLDVALVPLRRSSTFESVIPSKVFETVAMNIPILLGVNGETRNIIEHYNAGIYFEPENEHDFLQKLNRIYEQVREDQDHFSSGCQRMAMDFDRKNLALNMLETISKKYSYK